MRSQVLVVGWSKRPNWNFWLWGGQNGRNFQEGYFWDHWCHVLEQISLSRAKIWKFDPFCRTSKCDEGLFARQSKRPNLNFRPCGGKIGWNFQEAYFWDHCRHVLEQSFLSRAKICKSYLLLRTSLCDHRVWSHDGQKDRIDIFGLCVVKMGEISRRDILETTGTIFQSKILSPGQKFGNLTRFVSPQMRSQVLVARRSKRPNRNFLAWCAKNGWNFQERYFRDHWQWRHVLERNSLSRANISAGESILLRNMMGKMFPSRDIYEFRPPLGQKFRFDLFDQGAIRSVKFPISSTGESISLRNLKAKV